MEEEPGEQPFFKNPNRVNSFGVTQNSEAFKKAKLRSDLNRSAEKTYGVVADQFQTSYASNFNINK